MSLNHGINTIKAKTNFASVSTATSGIPVFIGCWPVHAGAGYHDTPDIAYSYDEAKKIGGYSEAWRTAEGEPLWTLCECVYSHFVHFRMAPAIFINVYDPSKHKKEIASTAYAVENHIVTLPYDAIIDDTFAVVSGETPLVKGTDYNVSYDSNNCIIELIEDGAGYEAESVNITYNVADLSKVVVTDIEAAVEKIEKCKALFGIVPDLIVAPGWSSKGACAAVMAAKASAINGLFKAKAVVSVDAESYSEVLSAKTEAGLTDENMIVCWPMAKIGDRVFDMDVLACGAIATVDSDNAGVPYESPSNKPIPITGCVTKSGKEVNLSVQEADFVSYSAGVVTALNFNGWVLWGNYTACHPGNSDVAEYFICTSRVMDFICNTFVESYWSYIDKPGTKRVIIDALVNSFNMFLNGLTANGQLCGGEIEYNPSENTTGDLINGIFKLHTKVASPTPAQRIDMIAEFDVEKLNSIFA